MSRKTLLIVLGLLVAGGLSFTPATVTAQRRGGVAQAADAGPFGALRWRSVGPSRGGRSLAAAGSVARPYEYYMGATGGGLWKTTDGGTTWQPVTDGQISSSSVGAVAVAPSNPDVVYIGTGEADIRGNIIQGDGAYKSIDAGKTWTKIGLADTQNISRIRVHPTNPDLVYVAAFGHHAAPNPERGVFRSKDGGKTWEKVLFRDSKTGAIEIVLDPNNAEIIYAALWEASRNSWEMSSGGPGSGLFKSTDGGDHWTEISRNPGLPKGVLGKIGLSVSGVDSTRVYVQIEAEDGGFFLTNDAGATWTKVTERRDLRQRAFYYSRVYADPKVRDTVYVLNVNFMKSVDAGKTWTTVRVPHGDNHDLWIAANDSNRMIEANDGGASVSVTGGATWTAETMPTAQFYHVITTAHVPYHICGAQQDNSTACVSSQAAQGGPGGSGGDADRVFYSVGGGESGYIASDPRAPDVFFAGSYGGLITRLDKRTGQEREVNPYPDNPMGYASADIAERFQWTFPIVMAPTNPGIIYVGSQHVWRSTNEGQSWTKISPDVTRHDPKTMGASGGPITKDNTGVETYATVFTIAPSARDANVIWTGSDDGYVFVTRDGGTNWKNVTPKDLPDFARISLVEASPLRAGTAYVAANRYQQDDFAPYVYRTDDYGATWTKITNGVGATDFARAIREDPKRAKLLYLGTEHGIYVSFDDGANWQSLKQNLPDTPVHDIAFDNAARDLVIATHGRGFYVMDNISPLRQGGIQTTTNFHLYKPEDALRGLDRALAVDYYLKADAQNVKMEFLDGQGKVIRTFTGTPADAERRPAPPGEDGGFGRPPDPHPAVTAGLHRLNWDMRYAGATDFPGLIMWAASSRGPQAPPATYQVRVTADGQTETQPFTIRREPHVLKDVSDQDLREQFDLAIQIRDKASAANEAVLLIRGIKSQIEERKKDARAAPVVRALEDLAKALSDVESEIYQVKLQSSQDPLNFPIKLNNKIAALQGVVESADVRPTEQVYTVFRTLVGQLDQQLSKLDSAVKTRMPTVNQTLQRQQVAPLKAEPLKTQATDGKPNP
ncbi:MAG: glycosyl hydrolase [Acidobacteria bacterium]|nr:glycosyl hydrolase [Acidobacteriota bacterium]